MKVLIISYDFYPDNSPNTYRWFNVLKEWEKRGIEIHVLCFQKGCSAAYEEIGGIQIYRTGKSLFERLKNIIFRISENSVPNPIEESSKKIKKANLIRSLYDHTWKKLYFPDFAFLWTLPAIKKGKQIIKNENINNVITISWPFSDHVIGAKLKKEFPNINWIADTIDPFYLSKAVNNSTLYHNLNYKFEKKILASADVVTVLTNKMKDKYASLYPFLKNKLIVNHNIFVPYEKVDVEVNNYIDKTTLVFVGTLSPITRSPLNLLKLFEKLLINNPHHLDLELHFYGDYKQCVDVFDKFHHFIGKHIFIHGQVKRESIPTIINNASVLVNIGNSNAFQEPSKILEYIYLGKLILNVCSIDDDSSLEILSKYSLNFNVMKKDGLEIEKVNEISEFILKNSSIGNEVTDEILREYLLPEVEKRYFQLLIK